jgi:broad specificity phosphatase PhoE
MSTVYLLRHAEKDAHGILSAHGKSMAMLLRKRLPAFGVVVSSPSPRSLETAELLTGHQPIVDARADYPRAPQDVSDAINKLADEQSILFSAAARIYDDPEVLKNMGEKQQN